MRCLAIELGSGYRSELKSRFARAVGERLHASVEAVAAAVEHAGLGAGLLGALRQQLARALGLLHAREPLQVASVQFTAASVRPLTSSISWACTPRFERNTDSRGRSAEPCTF